MEIMWTILKNDRGRVPDRIGGPGAYDSDSAIHSGGQGID